MRSVGSRLAICLAALAVIFLAQRSASAPARRALAAVKWAVTADIPPRGVLETWLGKAGISLGPVNETTSRKLSGSKSSLPVIVWPMSGAVVVPFGTSSGSGANVTHAMIEIRAPAGTPVRSATSGIVESATKTGEGELVLVGDGPYTITYRGIGSLRVEPDHPVSRGEVLGLLFHQGPGTTSELGFEVQAGSTPIDPASLLPSRAKGN